MGCPDWKRIILTGEKYIYLAKLPSQIRLGIFLFGLQLEITDPDMNPTIKR